MEQIHGIVKHYDWGRDSNSIVAKLAIQGFHTYENEASKFAELWFGTHPSGTFMINEQPAQFKLPYLLKVLSIGKALSIQVHPDRATAEKLHNQFPDIYKDPNPKPEIAIPLTNFEALAGLLSPEETLINLEDYPEIKHYTDIKSLLLSGVNTNELLYRLNKKENKTQLDNLILRLDSQFPNDIGILCPIYMRYHNLDVGQALFIPSGVPHAYISGEIIEAMECSDNVVRVALTNKFKDMDTLFQIMNDNQPIIYNSEPYNEFNISIINYKSNTILEIESNTILLVLEGSGKNLYTNEIINTGFAFYIENEIKTVLEGNMVLIKFVM
jgi:mannose-6-phosphate isomerase